MVKKKQLRHLARCSVILKNNVPSPVSLISKQSGTGSLSEIFHSVNVDVILLVSLQNRTNLEGLFNMLTYGYSWKKWCIVYLLFRRTVYDIILTYEIIKQNQDKSLSALHSAIFYI